MRNCLRSFLLFLSLLGFFVLVTSLSLAPVFANDHAESTPREKQVRPKAAPKKNHEKEEQKKEKDFQNNISSSKHTSNSFEDVAEPEIDAIILLDSSGSMLRTDPHRLREQAAKLFIRFLSEKDRVSLFQFDQEVKRLSEFTNVSVESVVKLDEAIQSVSTEGRFTDLELPLEVALSTLRIEARPKAKKIVILLSDGQMDPAANRGDPTELTEKLFEEVLPQYRADKILVYTVAMSPEADKELLYKIAVDGQGLRFEASDVQTLHKRFSDLYLSLKRPQVVESEGGGFEIDTSVNEATFYIAHKQSALTEDELSLDINSLSSSNSSQPEAASASSSSAEQTEVKEKPIEVSLYSPTNEKITMLDFPPGVRWYRGELFDVVTIRKPMPGTWRLQGVENPEGFATLVTDLKLQSRFDKTSMKIGDSQTVSVRLMTGGKIFNETGLKDVTSYRYKVISVKTGNTIQQGELNDLGHDSDEKEQDGVFSALIRASEEGDFKLLVGVTSPTFSRQQQIPFEVSPGAIELLLVKGDEFAKTADSFLITLTSKGKKLKNPEIEILAKKEDGKILGFKLKPSADGYKFDSSKLAAGKYTITGRVSAKNAKTGEVERSNSQAIEYEKVSAHDGKEVEEAGVEITESDAEGHSEHSASTGPSYLGEIIALVLAFCWAGGLVFYMTKKVDIAKNLPSPETPYLIPESLSSRIKAIEQKASKESRPPTNEDYEIFELVKSALPEIVVPRQESIIKDELV